MGFSYMNGNEWKDVTRDERWFCADLFFQLKENDTVKEFTKALIKKVGLKGINNISNPEMGFEVAYYRDVIFDEEFDEDNEKIKRFADKKSIQGLLKRTFDLCIFLPKDIIIIEAKAVESLTNKQMLEFVYDDMSIKALHDKLFKIKDVNVHIVGLVGDGYTPRLIEDYMPENLKKIDKKVVRKIATFKKQIIKWSDIEKFKVGYKMPENLKDVYSRTSDVRKLKNTSSHNVITTLENIEDQRRVELGKLKKT